MRIFSLLLMLTLSANALADDDPPVLVPIKRLTLDYAVRVAEATIAACREQGVNVAVAVVDRGGLTQVLLRDTLAMPLTVPVAEGKARAALNFNAPTSEMAASDISQALRTAGGVLVSAGGVPIAAGGSIIGGVGVSGAPSGEMDEACARAGVEAILEDLEMAE